MRLSYLTALVDAAHGGPHPALVRLETNGLIVEVRAYPANPGLSPRISSYLFTWEQLETESLDEQDVRTIIHTMQMAVSR